MITKNNDINNKNKIKFIVNSAVLAGVLEASSFKPGNVNPSHNFKNTRYEHFLSGSIALGSAIKNAATARCEIGKYILQGVSDIKKSHNGGNTHLGILMLFVPVASAAGLCLLQDDLKFKRLRKNTLKILNSTTPDDAVNLCNAINLAGAGGMGKKCEFDLDNENLNSELIENNITFYDLMKLSAKRDRIAEELTTGANISFEHAELILKIYNNSHNRDKDIFPAIVQTYLIILSKFPDTLIARKRGIDAATEVSNKAQEVINYGGVFTEKGRIEIKILDEYLRSDGNSLNPGTTADIVAASLFIAILKGLKI